MSNVLRRNRAISEVAFLDNAKKIRVHVTALVLNEKVIPKRYRFVYAIPCVDMARDLVKNANTYYNCTGVDDDQFNLYRRKVNALRNMRDCCDNILAELQAAREHLFIKMSAREQVVGLIVDEEELIEELLETEQEKHANFLKNNLKK